jgi:hypothetical protein
MSVLQRASLRGEEYAWALSDIPLVIDAVRDADLLNVGGQLQFRIPEKFGGGICECYWVSVDTFGSVPKDLRWGDRVVKTAKTALAEFMYLKSKYDFVQEGMNEFGERLAEAEKRGGNIKDMMYFVWYALDEKEEAEMDKKSELLKFINIPE